MDKNLCCNNSQRIPWVFARAIYDYDLESMKVPTQFLNDILHYSAKIANHFF